MGGCYLHGKKWEKAEGKGEAEAELMLKGSPPIGKKRHYIRGTIRTETSVKRVVVRPPLLRGNTGRFFMNSSPTQGGRKTWTCGGFKGIRKRDQAFRSRLWWVALTTRWSTCRGPE